MKHSIYLLFMLIASLMIISSCSDDEPVIEDPIASFQYEQSEEDYRVVTFTNFSQNYETSVWDFGDGSTSTEESPEHTYAEAGNYEVKLTVTGAGGAEVSKTETVSVVDPLAAQRTLFGDDGKTWQLLADNSTGVNTLQVGPAARNEIWWSLGGTDPVCVRPCIMDDIWTFNPDGSFTFDNNGDFWGEGGVWPEELVGCFDATNPDNWVNTEGTDISAWNSGTHQFTFNTSANTLTVSGEGAFVGLAKAATSSEVTAPVSEVTYKVIKLVDGPQTDTLVLETELPDGGGYWQSTLVSYDAVNTPVVVEPCEEEPFGEDLENIAPASIGHTFETSESFDLLGTIGGASVITPGVTDPVDAGATNVGEYTRIATQWQEAQLRIAPEPKDIDFTNITTVSVDVYLPSSNDYDNGLTKKLIIGFADVSNTEQWWTNIIQYESAELPLDEWTTVTFDLTSAPTPEGPIISDRDDLDMIFIQFGGGGHTTEATFYLRNLSFE